MRLVVGEKMEGHSVGLSLGRLEAGDMTFAQVTSVPAVEDDSPELVRARRLQIESALAGVHARGSLFVSAWLKPTRHALSRSNPLAVLIGGQYGFPLAPGAMDANGRHGVLFPPGAEGVPVASNVAVDELRSFPLWTRCLGSPDALARHPDGAAQYAVPRWAAGLEQRLAHIGDVPFAWLVVAEPEAGEAIEAHRRRLSNDMAGLADRAQQSGINRLHLERAEERLRELVRRGESGFWRLHVLVGARSREELGFLGPLLVSGAELDNLPYALHVERDPTKWTSIDEALAEARTGVVAERTDPSWLIASSPFLAGVELLAALGRPPERELYGIRITTPNRFDMSPEDDNDLLLRPPGVDAEASVVLGDVLDDGLCPTGSFRVPMRTLNRHALVCGATGAGKSQTIRHLLEELTAASVPWLVIEPAKSEYRRMAGRLRARFGDAADVTVLRLGDRTALPALLNPLEPEPGPPGFPLQTHIDLTVALFLAAFEAEEPFPQVLAESMRRCYEHLGWDLALGEYKPARWSEPSGDSPTRFPTYPTMRELQATARQVVREIGYSEEITRNVLGFVDVRLGSLRLGTPGRFFEGGHPLDLAALLRRNVVVEIEDVGNDQDKAFVIGTLLIRLMERLRLDHAGLDAVGPPELRHVTVVEEAHRLLRRNTQSRAAVHAVETFASLLAEVRAYGEGLVIAEQIPTKVVGDVVKNTALQVVHRLPAGDDRELVGAAMNLSAEQSEFVVSLRPGVAAVFSEGMDHAVLVRMPAGEVHESGVGHRTDVPLRAVRSPACPAACRAEPCRSERLSHAAQLVARLPHLVLWCELVVVAHLTGNADPIARPDLMRRMQGEGKRLLGAQGVDDERRLFECALASVVQAAIDARRSVLADYFAPDAFAEHLRDRMTGQLWNFPVETTPDARWQAGAFRFVDVWRTARGTTGVIPPAVVEGWRQRGIDIPDGPAADIAEQVRCTRPLTMEQTLALLHGTAAYPPTDDRERSALEVAAIAVRPATVRDRRLDLAVELVTEPGSAQEALARLWPWFGVES